MRGSRRVPVQLLRDFAGLGSRGEIVNVPPGRMRNELHVNNGAAYVLKGEALRIPLRTREEIVSLKKAQEAKIAAQKAQEAKLAQLAEQQRLQAEKEARFTAVAGGLKFEFGSKASSVKRSTEASAYFVEAALNMLPKVLRVEVKTDDGSVNYTAQDLCKHVSKMTGTEVSPALLEFEVPVQKGKTAKSKYVDYIGRYKAVFTMPTVVQQKIVFDLEIKPSKPLASSIPTLRPYGPLKAKNGAETVKDNASENETISGGKKSTNNDSKKFEWENDIIRDL